jgi:Mg-chelatase subunit ChlD
MVIEHGPHRTVDSWTSDGDEDDDFCYVCDDWAEDDGHGNCKECGVSFKTVDPFISPATAKVYSSPAPKISAYGDVWNRGGQYTWGSGGSWWGGSGSFTSQWGGGWSSANADREARMLKHKRHLDSLCKVVDPTVKHTLNFSTNKSYSNMERGTIFVDGSLLKDNDDKLDIVAGLSIHEKLHLVHTQPLIRWEKSYAYEKKLSGVESKLLHNIGNIVEDEFIESQLAKTHAGYVEYIQKVKEHYFEKHGDKIEKCEDPFGDVLNTLLAMVRYPQVITKERRKKHAKHIQFFARALTNALRSREESLKAIESLYDYMRQLAKKQAEATKGADEEEMMKRAEEKLDEILGTYEEKGMSGELSADDIEKMKDRLLRDERSEAERHSRYGDQQVMRDGTEAMTDELVDYEKTMGKISDALDGAIKELEDSDYSEEKWDKGKTLGLKVSNKITWRNQKANTERSKNDYQDALVQMKGAISGLKRRIDLYGDTKIHTIRNQKRGRLDKKMLHKIPLGRDDLFKNIVIDEDKPLDVCLLVDESGSMGHGKMKRARETAIALREALKDNPALSLWVFGHTADGYAWDGKGDTNMSIYWSPTYQTDMSAMGAMSARCENRDGMAILSSADRVKHETTSPSSNKLMIVISDGEPSASQYRGYTAINHTRKVVKHIESQGWSVIQVGISGAREHTMCDMFKNWIYIDDSSQLVNKVSRIIRKVIKV